MNSTHREAFPCKVTKVLVGQLLDLVPSKTQVLQVHRQTGGVDLRQEVVAKVEVPEGVGQGVCVQLGEEVPCHGELANPVVRDHALGRGQHVEVQAVHLRKGR